ncbi:MAG: hemerythrin domain-containing protein, partial [Pseudomonadota bacterium]|nr:hemerythrin domain-containing protein [Pseudomonadota bacterium]
MFGVSLLLLVLVIAVILGLMAGPSSPITWLLIAGLLVIPFIHKKLTAKRFFTWKEEYSVGIDSIDQQHKKLLSLINQLQTAVDYSTGKEFEREALDELVTYTKDHFSYEEGLMEKN